MKKLLYTLVPLGLYTNSSYANSLKDAMTPSTNSSDNVGVYRSGEWALDQVLNYATVLIFMILWVVAVWVFIYLWFKLISSRWNEEEFKKALMWFVYAVVWLALIPMAYLLIKLITSLEIF